MVSSMEQMVSYLMFFVLCLVGALIHQFKKKDWKNTDAMSWVKVLLSGFAAGIIVIGLGELSGKLYIGDLSLGATLIMGLAVGFSSDSIVAEFLVRSKKYKPDINAYFNEAVTNTVTAALENIEPDEIEGHTVEPPPEEENAQT